MILRRGCGWIAIPSLLLWGLYFFDCEGWYWGWWQYRRLSGRGDTPSSVNVAMRIHWASFKLMQDVKDVLSLGPECVWKCLSDGEIRRLPESWASRLTYICISPSTPLEALEFYINLNYMHRWYPEGFTLLYWEMLKPRTVLINFWVPPENINKIAKQAQRNFFCELWLGSI